MKNHDYENHRVAMVTGGAGFLGSHVCERLLNDGLHVVCVDNLMTGRRQNIAHLRSSNFEFLESDIAEPLPMVQVNEIWNLACPASPPHYQIDPVHTMMTNVIGMKNCLDLARANGAQLFQASTSEVYGDPEIHPQVESYRGQVNSTGPRACYDEGKRAAETLCYDYARTYGLDVRVARIFNTFGPRMDPEDGRVVSNFVVSALLGHPLHLYGDGLQTRSFCYVDDLVDGFFALMRAPQAPSGPINLGNPGELTMRDLAGIVIEETGSSSKVITASLPVDDPKQRRPDITAAWELLGWKPTIQLRAGLAATIAHFRNELWLAPHHRDEPQRPPGHDLIGSHRSARPAA